MAASAPSIHYPAKGSNTVLGASFSFYNPPSAASPPSPPQPQGACNYRELNLGHTCGCKRFSANSNHGVQDSNEACWCYCGHHACFHEREEHLEVVTGTCDENIFSSRVNLGTSAASFPATVSMQRNVHGIARSPGSIAARIGLSQASIIGAEHIDSRAQTPQIHSSQHFVGSVQSSFKVPSDTSSSSKNQRASPSRHFMRQLARSHAHPALKLPTSSALIQVVDDARSPTELATANNSIVGSPHLGAADDALRAVNDGLDQLNDHLAVQSAARVPVHPIRVTPDVASSSLDLSTNEPLPLTERLLTQISSLKAVLLTVPNMSNAFTSLAQRVSVLENTSFGHVSLDDLQDRYELLDGRLLDVEGRLQELEKICDATISQTVEYAPPNQTRSQRRDSEVSLAAQDVDCKAAPSDSVRHAPHFPLATDSETTARLNYLERRLAIHEASALPSPTNPWEIEVVLLPWGRELKGIWSSLPEFSQVSMPSSAESEALLPEHEISPSWRTPSSDDWLFPRACGPTNGIYGRVYDRLKSRGFVHTITITNSSARAVEIEIMWALVTQLQALDDDRRAPHTQVMAPPELIALSNPWIPLLKVHRSSRLRFLTAAELATPSLWTVEFLNSTAFMRAPSAGRRRLYITHAAGYMQRPTSSHDWTWLKLHQLPRVKHTPDTGGINPLNKVEACWDYDARLDRPLSNNTSVAGPSSSGSSFASSFASPPPSPLHQHLQLTPRVVRSLEDENVHEHAPLSGKAMSHAAISFRHPGHVGPTSQFHRTSSAPIISTEDGDSMASTSKRQFVSFDDANVQCQEATSLTKRRRLSKTSSGDGIRASGWGFTPRLSREPPSPDMANRLQFQHPPRPMSRRSDHDGITDVATLWRSVSSATVGQANGRGTTPNVYATPFSYSVHGGEEVIDVDLGDLLAGDTDVDGIEVDEVDSDSSADGNDENQLDPEQAFFWRGSVDTGSIVTSRDVGAASGNDEDVWEGVGDEDGEQELDNNDMVAMVPTEPETEPRHLGPRST